MSGSARHELLHEPAVPETNMLSRSSREALRRHPGLSYCAAALLVAVATLCCYWMKIRWQLSAPAAVYLAAVTASTWLGGARPGLLATALSLVCFYYVVLPLEGADVAAEPVQLVPEILWAIVACYVIWMITTERSAAESLRHLSRRLLTVQEDERHHLSRELHDEFGQLLATVTLHLQAAKAVAGERPKASLEQSIHLLQQAGAQVRSLALELCPRMLETEGLEATLRWLAQQHEQRTTIAIQLACHVSEVCGDRAIVCFRVAQEALTNAVRHAQARHVWIDLSQSGGFLQLEVRDDGVGFDVTRAPGQAGTTGNLGIIGMRERVELAGGTLQIHSQPGHGTRIRVSLPLAQG
jgi:signal transduction histidine kinase